MSHDNPAKSSEPRWGDREDRIRELEHPYAELKSRLTRHAQSGWSIATDAVVAIDELERKLKKMTEDRDMWFNDDIKQNNNVGRLVAERDALKQKLVMAQTGFCPICGMDDETVKTKGCYDDRCRYEMKVS
jgi:hypothetical protein